MHRMRCLNLFPNHQKSAVPPFSTSLVGSKTLQKPFVSLFFAAHATHLNGAHFISSNPFCMLSNPFFMFSNLFSHKFYPFYLLILSSFCKHPSLFLASNACLRSDNETSVGLSKCFSCFSFSSFFKGQLCLKPSL